MSSKNGSGAEAMFFDTRTFPSRSSTHARTSSARADPRRNSADVAGYKIAFEASFSEKNGRVGKHVLRW
jgi:hypothetical protein